MQMFSEKPDIEARDTTCYEDKRVLLLSETPGVLRSDRVNKATYILPATYI